MATAPRRQPARRIEVDGKTNMLKSKFARCFPLPDGNVCCKHWNGRYIVFPGSKRNDESEGATGSGNENTATSEK